MKGYDSHFIIYKLSELFCSTEQRQKGRENKRNIKVDFIAQNTEKMIAFSIKNIDVETKI